MNAEYWLAANASACSGRGRSTNRLVVVGVGDREVLAEPVG